MRNQIQKAISIFSINILLIVIFFGVLEIISRLLFPEFKGHIHAYNKTLGIINSSDDFHGISVRLPFKDAKLNYDKPNFVILGDSISGGYGLPYDDIYWVQLSRRSKINDKLQYTPLIIHGANLEDSSKLLNKVVLQSGIEIRQILYQFNFNDITPNSYSELYSEKVKAQLKSPIFSKITAWRYEYLNYSVFLRIMQHFGGQLIRETSGSCEKRGMDALSFYTWTFGSKGYEEESNFYWERFENQLISVNDTAKKLNSTLTIFVTPLIYDIDTKGLHPHFNHTKLDFSCATIDPRVRLAEISARNGIKLLDPTKFMRERFEARISEGNFTPFFFTADDNHITSTASGYLADFLSKYFE